MPAGHFVSHCLENRQLFHRAAAWCAGMYPPGHAAHNQVPGAGGAHYSEHRRYSSSPRGLAHCRLEGRSRSSCPVLAVGWRSPLCAPSLVLWSHRGSAVISQAATMPSPPCWVVGFPTQERWGAGLTCPLSPRSPWHRLGHRRPWVVIQGVDECWSLQAQRWPSCHVPGTWAGGGERAHGPARGSQRPGPDHTSPTPRRLGPCENEQILGSPNSG